MLYQIMEKGLETDPEQNDQSVRELQEALHTWLDEEKMNGTGQKEFIIIL